MSADAQVAQTPDAAQSSIKSPRFTSRMMSTDNRENPFSITKFRCQRVELIEDDLDYQNKSTEPLQELSVLKPHKEELLIDSEVEMESNQDSAFLNGLDPMGIDLISGARTDLFTDEPITIKQRELSVEKDKIEISPTAVIKEKISREVRNLQKMTNESKVLSNFMNTSIETPRRGRKQKDTLLIDPDAEEHEKESPESSFATVTDGSVNDSDATLVLPTREEMKRRKSLSRSRDVRARSRVRNRRKSLVHMMNGEMTEYDNAEEQNELEKELDDDMNNSMDSRVMNQPPKLGHDAFCFKCHNDSQVLSLACTHPNCRRSYHRQCVRPNPIPRNNDEFVCPDCTEIENAENSDVNKYGHPKIDQDTLSDMLHTIVERIRQIENVEIKTFEKEVQAMASINGKPKEQQHPLIVNLISIATIEKRIQEKKYKVSEEFIRDIKQLDHNWFILGSTNQIKLAKHIMRYTNSEIYEMEMCVFCYQNAFLNPRWFTSVCNRPHLIVWAKLKGYPYWPAKVMSVDALGRADVRFFGAHDRCNIPPSQVLLYSEKDPNKTKGSTSTPPTSKSSSKTQKTLSEAVIEATECIENLRDVYGFQYYPIRTPFDPSKMEEYLETMFPNTKKKDSKEIKSDHREKDAEGSLKMKIIKTPSGGLQTIEQSSSQSSSGKQKSSEKNDVYAVMNKSSSGDTEQSGRVSLLLVKQRSVVENSKRSKKLKNGDTSSETPENGITTMGTPSTSTVGSKRQSGPRNSANRSKVGRNEKDSNDQPPTKRMKHADKQKTPVTDENKTPEEQQQPAHKHKKTAKHRKSLHGDPDSPLIVTLNHIPPGTDLVRRIRSVSKSPPPAQRNKRSRSEKNVDRDIQLTTKNIRLSLGEAKTAEPTVVSQDRKSIDKLVNETEKPVSSRQPSPVNNNVPTPVTSTPTAQVIENPSIEETVVIKLEPMDPDDTIEQENIPGNADIDNSNARKVFLVSTDDRRNSASGFKNGRARKTFPNQIGRIPDPPPPPLPQNILQPGTFQAPVNQAMVYIPQNFQQSPAPSNVPPLASLSGTGVSEVSIHAVQRSAGNVNRHILMNGTSPRSMALNQLRLENGAILVRRMSALTNGESVATYQQPSNIINQRQLNQGQHFSGHQLPEMCSAGIFAESNNYALEAGLTGRILSENSQRISNYFRNVMLETIQEISPHSTQAENILLKNKIEKLTQELQKCKDDMMSLKAANAMEIQSIRTSNETLLRNIQSSVQTNMEHEKNKLISELRGQFEEEKKRVIERAIKETKNKQWCSNCGGEAKFHCCWNTSYCNETCQQAHWSKHLRLCNNKKSKRHTSTTSTSTNTTNISVQTSDNNLHMIQQSPTHATIQLQNINNECSPTNTIRIQPNSVRTTQIFPSSSAISTIASDNQTAQNVRSIFQDVPTFTSSMTSSILNSRLLPPTKIVISPQITAISTPIERPSLPVATLAQNALNNALHSTTD